MRAPALLLALAGCPWAGCQPPDASPQAPAEVAATLRPDSVSVRGVLTAAATVTPVGGSGVGGTVRLTQTTTGVRVRADLQGLGGRRHALQILHARDCEADPSIHLGAADGTPHGPPEASAALRHTGDLGNVRVSDGRGRYDRIHPGLTLAGTDSASGRAVVVREGVDDGATQPDGRPGEVVGCGLLSANR